MLCDMHLSLQGKVTELQTSKKSLEEKLEALRTVKETAEQPEKEAKERHLKAWEGKYRDVTTGGHYIAICILHHMAVNMFTSSQIGLC